jgi:cobalamin transport system substrate-binding protein
MIRRAFIVAALAVLFAACLSAARSASTTPKGSDPAIAERSETPGQSTEPHRIVSLVPAVTEMLFAIGAGDAVVGVSSYDHYPAAVASRTRVGALVDPDFERILSLRPDLVVVYGTQNDLVGRLTRAGIAMFNYEHAGLADITQTMQQLGDRTGHSIEARREVDRIETGLATIRRRVAGQHRPPTILVFEREPGALRGMFASGGIGFLHDMLDTAGGANVFADAKRQNVQVSTEMLLASAPEVILELRPSEGWSADRIARERSVWKTLASLPAVRTNRIYIFDDDIYLVPGPRVLEAVQHIADVLHPRS